MQRRQRQAHVTAGDGIEPGTFEGEREELRDGRLTVGAGDGDGGAGPEQRTEIKLTQAMQARPARGEDPRMRLREARAINQEVVAGGFLGTELPVLPTFVIDDRGEASRSEGFRDRTTAHALAEDGGGPSEAAAERFGELAHRSLRESRPRRPHSRERIQKRATTLVAGQPFFWKW